MSGKVVSHSYMGKVLRTWSALQDPSPPPVLEGRAWPSQRPQSPAMPQTPNGSPPDNGAYPPVVHSSQEYLPASSAPVEVCPPPPHTLDLSS